MDPFESKLFGSINNMCLEESIDLRLLYLCKGWCKILLPISFELNGFKETLAISLYFYSWTSPKSSVTRADFVIQ